MATTTKPILLNETGLTIVEKLEAIKDAIEDGGGGGGGTTDHSDLENLGYSDSGHTGFQASISDLETIRTGAAAGATAYQKPSGGIPSSDMSSGVTTSLGKADSSYQKPSSGIPASDLAETYVKTSVVGANSGVAELDVNGKLVTSQLPGSYSEIISKPTLADFPTTGAADKVYFAQDTALSYRWTGTTYGLLDAALALGETLNTAYRGDRGKTAYDHSQNGDVHVTSEQKTAWDSKYVKPSGGIPASDLAESYSVKPSKVTSITAGAVTLADNTEYVLTDVTAMAISFPASGDYACWFRFNTAATGTINITFPSGAKYVGSVPAFSNNQQWMMYIENGMVVANKAV